MLSLVMDLPRGRSSCLQPEEELLQSLTLKLQRFVNSFSFSMSWSRSGHFPEEEQGDGGGVL